MSEYIGIDLGTVFTRVASTYSSSRHEQGQVTVLDCDLIKRQIRTAISVRKNSVLVGNQITSNCDIENTAYFLKDLIGKTHVDKQWKSKFGMQYAIREQRKGENQGLKVGFWFDNTHREFLSVEYALKIIIEYCREALNKMSNSVKVKHMAISVPSYWDDAELKSYRLLMNMIDVDTIELVRDHVAIAYYYGCYHMFHQENKQQDICFVNISYDYAFSMICSYKNGWCFIKNLTISRYVCGRLVHEKFEQLFFRKLESYPCNLNRESFLSKPRSILSLMSVIEKSKLDACLHGLDSCYVDMSKIGDLGMDQLEIPQKEFFDCLREDRLMTELKKMILKSKKDSGVGRLDAVCVCGSTVRVEPIREVIDEAAREMGTKAIDVLSVDEAVCQGLVYEMQSCYDMAGNNRYGMNGGKTAFVMGEGEIDLNVPHRLKNDRDDKNEEKYDSILAEKQKILDERMNIIKEYNKELDKVHDFMNEMDEDHRKEVQLEYNRYSAITGMDSSKHFYPKEHYDLYLASLKQFHVNLKKWKKRNYCGVVSIVAIRNTAKVPAAK